METIKLGALFLMTFLLLGTLGTFVSAQDVVEEGVELEEAGTTPDSPLYGLDNAMDRIRLAFTFNRERKAERAMLMAEERLAEADAMITANQTAFAERAQERHDFFVQKAEEALADIESDGEEAVAENALRIITRIQNRIEAHQEKVEAVHTRILERQSETMTDEQLEHLEEVFANIKERANNAEAQVSQRKENVKTKYKVLTEKSDEEVEEVLDEIESEEELAQNRLSRKERAEKRIERANQVTEKIVTRFRARLQNAENLTEEQKALMEQRINKFEVRTEERNEAIRERLRVHMDTDDDDSTDEVEDESETESNQGNGNGSGSGNN